MDRRSFLRTAAFIGAGASLAFTNTAGALPLISGVRLSREEKSFPIPATDSVQIDKDLDVIISRTSGKVYAFNLACPHQNTAIKWDQGKGRFQCPKHKSVYTPEGVFVEGRATRGLDRFAVRKEGSSIVVNLDALVQEDEDAEKWKKAFVTL
jgi:Rieske Fe-S protein